MKKREEQLAQELDAFLTARLQKRPLPPASPETAAEIRLADDLLQTAAQTEIDPIFLSSLEARLAAASQQKQTRPAPERPSFWPALINPLKLKEGFTMKRTALAFGALLALFIFGAFAWTAWQRSAGIEPDRIAHIDPTTLPPLPSLGSAPGMGSGFGGGGVAGMGGDEGEVYTESSDMEHRIMLWNPFDGTLFRLDSTLPTEPVAAAVYQQSTSGFYSLDDVARLAAIFDMDGPVYSEMYPGPEDVDGWQPVPVYIVFDGRRQLSVSDSHFYYFNWGLSPDSEAQLMPEAEARAIAEAFLHRHGLLDFPYQIVSPNGYDLEFRRVIEGRPLLFPEFQVSVAQNGQIWSVSNTPLSRLVDLGAYPLRSAEAAWQMVQAEGIDFQRIFYTIHSQPETRPSPPPVDAESYGYWSRQYSDGEVVTLYPYPSVFWAARNDGPPRIMVEQFLLQAPAADLEAIAQVGQPIMVRGIVRHTPQGEVVELLEWRPDAGPEFAFHTGIIQRHADQVFLMDDGGEIYLIASAPDSLPAGERVYVTGWIVEADEAEYPIFNWQSIIQPSEERVYEEFDREVDDYEPYRIDSVSISGVDLIYAVNWAYDESSHSSYIVVQPAWRFTGTTSNNEMIEIYIQAVDDAYLQTTTP